MDRPRTLRLLRIAFSAVCGIVCLLLIALSVRSYWWFDYTPGGGISSAVGRVYVGEVIVLRGSWRIVFERTVYYHSFRNVRYSVAWTRY